jgi:N-hydroxyarylamine O-acetyltransferase
VNTAAYLDRINYHGPLAPTALQPHEYSDSEEMCRYHQTSPLSHFTRGHICSRATPDGRVTLGEMRLIITRNGERQERALANEDEYAAMLRERFGVVLND